MSHSTASHLKHMLYAAAGIFVVLAIAGMPLGTALGYGVFLACPLMMVWMMIAMGDHGHGGRDQQHDTAATARRDATDLDRR
ncbi:MAG: DUF2933 domain-containing protein [Actinomycetes bacterium]